jgi:hypothetical protein
MDDDLIGIKRAAAGGAELLLLGPSPQKLLTFSKRLLCLFQIMGTRGDDRVSTGEVADCALNLAGVCQNWRGEKSI